MSPTRLHRIRGVPRAAFRTLLFLACLVLACVWVGAFQVEESSGIVNGKIEAKAKPWTVRIRKSTPGKPDPYCSGALVAKRWVLTAAHCVREGGGLESVINPSRLVLYIGTKAAFGGSTRGVDKIKSKQPFIESGRIVDDIALLHISGDQLPKSSEPLPLAFKGSVVPNGWPLVFWGYGASEAEPYGVLRTTIRGDWHLQNPDCHLRSACYQPAKGAQSYASTADSGAPVTGFVKGGWVQRGIFSGPPGLRQKYGASITAHLPWIRAVTGLPTVPAHTIVRDPKTGTSWLVGWDGFRRWIPTGGDYLCFGAQGIRVQNMSTFTAKSIPEDYRAQAICGFEGLQFRLTFGFHNSPLEAPYGTCPAGAVNIVGVAGNENVPMEVEQLHASVGGWNVAPIQPLTDLANFWQVGGVAGGIDGTIAIQRSNGEWGNVNFETGCPDNERRAIPESASFMMYGLAQGNHTALVSVCETGVYTRPDTTRISLTVTVNDC